MEAAVSNSTAPSFGGMEVSRSVTTMAELVLIAEDDMEIAGILEA